MNAVRIIAIALGILAFLVLAAGIAWNLFMNAINTVD